MKKIASIILVLVMVLSLAACKGSTKGGDAQDVKSGSDVSKNSEEPIKLTFWHQYTSKADKGKIAFDQVLEDCKKAFPEVELEVVEIENEIYKTQLKTAVAANEAPDIFYTWGAGFAKPFVDAGKLLPLNDYLEDGTRDRLLNGVLEHLTYDGQVYGLPRSMWIGTFYCNKELFDKYNVEFPKTFDDMLEAVKIFNDNGVTPMAVGEKDRWPGMFYYNILALRTAGAELSDKALRKEASYNSPEFIEAARKLQQLVQADAFAKGSLGLTRDESEAEFMRGNTAMYFNHSFPVAKFEGEKSGVKGKLVAMRFPMVEGGKGTENEFLGGVNEGFVVNANTKHKDKAVAVMKYISENASKQIYKAGSALPAWKADDITPTIPMFADIADLAKQGTGFIISWDTFLEGADADTHKNLVQEIFADITTPEKFAADHQKINE